MITSEALDKIAPAWVAALSELTTVSKDASGHHGKYVTIGAILALAKPILAKHDLAIQQYPSPSESGTVTVITRVWHTSGQWLEDDGLRMPAPNDPQKVGGSVTYARRYSLSAFLSLAADDDDGQSASDQIRGEAQRPRKVAAKKAAAPIGDPSNPIGGRAVAAAREINMLTERERNELDGITAGWSLTVQGLKADPEHLHVVEQWLATKVDGGS